jgi:type I restriction enzyme S subunit
MSLPAYAEYKDSGVEWLGDVPKHWQVTILKYNCSFSGGGTPSKEKPEYWGGNVPWVSPKDMKVFKLLDTEDKITKDAILESSTNMVKTGALLMVVRSGILQRKIPIAINFVDVTLNQDMKALRFKERIFAEYFSYLVMGHESKFLLLWLKQGATVESIEHEYLANSVIPWPSIEEQTTIARFLDHETAKIDALIAEQQRLIELLKEKRQAVISHAVTKGLDLNAPMKDSGVEWLGDVPEHWDLKKIFHSFASIGSGTTPKSDEEKWYSDDGVPWVTTGELRENTIFNTTKHVTHAAVLSHSALKLHPAGSLVMAMYGATIGRLGILGVDAVTNQACCVLSGGKNLDIKYVYYWLHVFKETIISLYSTGGGQPNINQENVTSLRVSAPDVPEQTTIARFLDQQTAKIDELISHAHQGIDLLKERRSALISAAVTGKIDVRGWQMPQKNLVEKVQ